jgi:hypothetical protein
LFPAETRYGVAVDVKRAADVYSQGWTLRQIGVELGLSSTTVSDQLRRAGVTMRRGGPPAHSISTQQILELHDQGLTWSEIAEQVDMTVSGAWSRYRRARPTKPPRFGRWQQVLAEQNDGPNDGDNHARYGYTEVGGWPPDPRAADVGRRYASPPLRIACR